MNELNIYQRLNAVMQDVGYVQKEDKKVNNQYTFVSHDAVTAKVRPFLIKHGVIMTTSVIDTKQDGNRTEAVVALEFVNIDKPDDRISVRAFGYGIDPQDKGPGKAVSYAVKYGILKTLCLETGDDPEQDTIDYKPVAKKTHRPTDGALDSLSPAAQVKVAGLAAAITAKFKAENEWGAFEAYETRNMENDETIALWSLLDSKVRSSIKRMKAEEDKSIVTQGA